MKMIKSSQECAEAKSTNVEQHRMPINTVNELLGLLKTYGKITILGHDNIDVDAFFSGILLTKLLQFLNVDCEFLILEKIEKNDTYNIVKELTDINMEDYYCDTEDSSRKLLLEDHYKTVHQGEVIACLDHHKTSEIVEYPFYYSRQSCSTSYMVYELMHQAEYEISREEAMIIIASMMIDTISFRSSKTVLEEASEARRLAEKYEFNYEALEKYCLCLTPLNVPDHILINNGYKYYNYNGNNVKSSYIQVYGMIETEKVKKWLENIQDSLKEKDLKMWVFIIIDCQKNETHVYCIEQEKIMKTKYPLILSRGNDIMPQVEEMFSK